MFAQTTKASKLRNTETLWGKPPVAGSTYRLCGEFTGDRWFPQRKVSIAESFAMLKRHHGAKLWFGLVDTFRRFCFFVWHRCAIYMYNYNVTWRHIQSIFTLQVPCNFVRSRRTFWSHVIWSAKMCLISFIFNLLNTRKIWRLPF